MLPAGPILLRMGFFGHFSSGTSGVPPKGTCTVYLELDVKCDRDRHAVGRALPAAGIAGDLKLLTPSFSARRPDVVQPPATGAHRPVGGR